MDYNKLSQIIEEIKKVDFSKFKEMLNYIQDFQGYLTKQENIIKKHKEELNKKFDDLSRDIKNTLKKDEQEIEKKLSHIIDTKYKELKDYVGKEFNNIKASMILLLINLEKILIDKIKILRILKKI